jgi:tRNA(Arg) A34 adenosine deaminase TadA
VPPLVIDQYLDISRLNTAFGNSKQSKNIAYVRHENSVYFSDCNLVPGVPFTPLTHLVQGIFERLGPNSFTILRKPIYTTYKPTETCIGMIKTAAKRHRFSDLKTFQNLIQSAANPIKIEYANPYSPPKLNFESGLLSPMKLATQLRDAIPKNKKRYLQNRPVSSVLVNKDGEIIFYAENSNAENKTLHAEVNLIQGYWAKYKNPIPKDAVIFSTLQPCPMCAGLIFDVLKPNKPCVFYLDPDTGPLVKKSILYKSKFEARYLL